MDEQRRLPGDPPAPVRPKTRREMLIQIDEAITTILLGGQSYKIGSRSLTRADLATLKNLRAQLQAEEAEDDGGLWGNTFVAVFDRR